MKNRNGFTLIELLIVVAIVGILGAIVLGGSADDVGVYGYLKSKDVSGQLESVTSAMPQGSIVGTSSAASVFQASVMIKQADGAYVLFSTDDRQWAALLGNAANGKCVTATVYPYVPWNFGKAGTYHSGRLISTTDCPPPVSR